MKTFIDLSHDNPYVDWDQLKQVPDLQGVVLKATEGQGGEGSQDLMFAVRYRANVNRGMLVVGIYHFYHAEDDPNKQADNYIQTRETVTQDKNILAIVDLEWDNDWANIPEQKRYDDLHTFIERLEQEGYEVVIYTSHAFMTQYLPAAGFLGHYLLWVAWYEADPPLLPPMWTNYWAWQYTGSGNIAGVEGPVDISYLNEA